MNLRTAASSSAALLGVVLLAGCPASEPASGPAAPPRPTSVQGVSPARRDIAREISLPVELWAWRRVSIVARVTGYVGAVPVDRGSVVRAGDALGEVSAPELEDERRKRAADVKVAEADVASAKASLELLSVTARRFAALVADRAVSVQEADEARARALVAEAVVAQTEAKLASARENLASTETWLAYTKIVAPFAGVVTERWVHPGAFVSSAERTPLFELVDAKTVRAVVDVPEIEASRIKVGETAVRVALPALGNKARAGVVSRRSGALDAKTRTLRIEVDLDNAAGDLAPGMFGQASLVLEVHAGVLAVPSSAVLRGAGEPAVFVVGGGKAERHAVQLGLDDGKVVEVVGGLEPDAVVATQARGLVANAAVELAPAEKRGP